ncbi:MAG: hypothetical protein ABID84_03875 [Chloroflexota bacterium]
MTFRDQEKLRYSDIKKALFGDASLRLGTYLGRPRSFCLDDDYSAENLYDGIRDEAVRYFTERRIPWHDGLNGRRLPSNHLCCSQSCCVNFLFPMASEPRLLERVFRHVFPNLREVLPILGDGVSGEEPRRYLGFEWIGTRDYLGEHIGKRGTRTRGANYTSADFVFRFLEQDGKIHLVLGEWKYTEEAGTTQYGAQQGAEDRKPEVRRRTYWSAFSRGGGTFSVKDKDKELYDALFFGPFYQFMRLQLLAQEMVMGDHGREMDADVASVLWVCPEANKEFRRPRALPPYLAQGSSGKETFAVWRELIGNGQFQVMATEALLDILAADAKLGPDPVSRWVSYLSARYEWGSVGRQPD